MATPIVRQEVPVLRPQHDTLWLKNGQFLFGEFKSLDVGIITFDAEVIDDVSLKHYEVATIRATSKIYRMKTLSNGELHGWILPGDTGYVRIYDLLDTTVVSFEELVYLTSFEGDFLKRWGGMFSAGYSFTKSSNITRWNMDASINYRGEEFDFDAAASSIITGEGDSLAREREEASVSMNYYFSDHWSIYGALTYQRNQTLGLKYRFQEGPGIVFTRYLTNQIRFGSGSGAVVNQEQSFEGARLNSVEIPILMSFTFYRYRNPKISLVVDQSVYFGVTTQGRFRHDGEIRLNWEIISDLSLQLKLYDSYDNQSPQTGGALLDYGIVTGVSYEF